MDTISSVCLSIISWLSNNDKVREEHFKLASIPAKITGENICDIIINVVENIVLNLSKITTDSAPNMTRIMIGA